MAHHLARSSKAQVPMSAMIDVVFLLLIFFILTKAPLVPEAHMAIMSPGDGGFSGSATILSIEVRPGPHYTLMGKREVTLGELRAYLRETAAFDRQQTVVVKVAPEATESSLVSVLDGCHEADLEFVNVTMLSPY